MLVFYNTALLLFLVFVYSFHQSMKRKKKKGGGGRGCFLFIPPFSMQDTMIKYANLLDSSGFYNRILLTGWLIKTKIYSSQFWSLEKSNINAPTDWDLVWDCFLVYKQHFGWLEWGSMASHDSRGKGALWELFSKGTNPIPESSTPWPNHFPKSSLPNTITLGIRFQHNNFRGHEYLIHAS